MKNVDEILHQIYQLDFNSILHIVIKCQKIKTNLHQNSKNSEFFFDFKCQRNRVSRFQDKIIIKTTTPVMF